MDIWYDHRGLLDSCSSWKDLGDELFIEVSGKCQQEGHQHDAKSQQHPSCMARMVEEPITELGYPIPMWMMGSLKKQKPVMVLNHQKQGWGGRECLNYYNNAEAWVTVKGIWPAESFRDDLQIIAFPRNKTDGEPMRQLLDPEGRICNTTENTYFTYLWKIYIVMTFPVLPQKNWWPFIQVTIHWAKENIQIFWGLLDTGSEWTLLTWIPEWTSSWPQGKVGSCEDYIINESRPDSGSQWIY